MGMARRFLNLVVESNRDGLYSLRRVPANRLFYPSRRAAEAATAKSEEEVKAYKEEHEGRRHPGLHFMERFGQFPSPMINFQASPTYEHSSRNLELATLLGDDENKILTVDNSGHTLLFDTVSYSVVKFPSLKSNKGRGAISLPVDSAAPQEPDGLYVMSPTADPLTSDCCFEGDDDGGDHYPYYKPTSRPHYQPPHYHGQPAAPAPPQQQPLGPHGVTPSTVGVATLAHDLLNFESTSMYVPDLNLWFGLSARHPYNLCAIDLSNAHLHPPDVLQTWLDLDIPKSWSPSKLNLISLGSGRFCAAKIFRSNMPAAAAFLDDSDDDDDYTAVDSHVIPTDFAVFTGLHMVRHNGKDGQEQIQMIKHKSIFYTFNSYNIEWMSQADIYKPCISTSLLTNPMPIHNNG
uniref:Uncharacterized protein n=1 Tax=Oryza glumipatula TaxID=40148 RepID=A0A0E0BMS1_9ORYZ